VVNCRGLNLVGVRGKNVSPDARGVMNSRCTEMGASTSGMSDNPTERKAPSVRNRNQQILREGTSRK
jgi:hypothetical protein